MELNRKKQGALHHTETHQMTSYGPWLASIIPVSKAQLLAAINPKRPPLRPRAELMFPVLHIKLRHGVVSRTLRGGRGPPGLRQSTHY